MEKLRRLPVIWQVICFALLYEVIGELGFSLLFRTIIAPGTFIAPGMVSLMVYKLFALLLIFGMNWLFIGQKIYFANFRPLTWGLLAVVWLAESAILVSIHGVNHLPWAIIMAMIPGIVEEMGMRGVVFGALRQRLKGTHAGRNAFLVSAGLFALLHLVNLSGESFSAVCVQMISALGGGLLFAALYQRSGNLLSAMAYHFSFDYITVGMGTPGGHPAGGFQLTTLIVVLVVFVIEATLAAVLIRAGKPEHRNRLLPKLGL